MPLTQKYIVDAFTLFDLDNNGYIDHTEIKLCFQGLGYDVTDEEIIEAIKKVEEPPVEEPAAVEGEDAAAAAETPSEGQKPVVPLTHIEEKKKKPDGALDFEEFTRLIDKKQSQVDSPSEVLHAFQIFDVDGSGILSIDDFRKVVRGLGENITEKELAEVVQICDIDMDGGVSFSDFSHVMSSLVAPEGSIVHGGKSSTKVSSESIQEQQNEIGSKLKALETKETDSRDERRCLQQEEIARRKSRVQTRAVTKVINKNSMEEYNAQQKLAEQRKREQREQQAVRDAEVKEKLRARRDKDYTAPRVSSANLNDTSVKRTDGLSSPLASNTSVRGSPLTRSVRNSNSPQAAAGTHAENET